MNILAMDLGKFNSMICFFDTKSRKSTFLQAATARGCFRKVLSKHPVDQVVMEACGPSGQLTEFHKVSLD